MYSIVASSSMKHLTSYKIEVEAENKTRHRRWSNIRGGLENGRLTNGVGAVVTKQWPPCISIKNLGKRLADSASRLSHDVATYVIMPSRKLHLSGATSYRSSSRIKTVRADLLSIGKSLRFPRVPPFRSIIQTMPGTWIPFQKSNHNPKLLFDRINEYFFVSFLRVFSRGYSGLF